MLLGLRHAACIGIGCCTTGIHSHPESPLMDEYTHTPILGGWQKARNNHSHLHHTPAALRLQVASHHPMHNSHQFFDRPAISSAQACRSTPAVITSSDLRDPFADTRDTPSTNVKPASAAGLTPPEEPFERFPQLLLLPCLRD